MNEIDFNINLERSPRYTLSESEGNYSLEGIYFLSPLNSM